MQFSKQILELTSMGSTSLAMTTSCAFFFSMRVVTVLTPCLTTAALLVGASSLPSDLVERGQAGQEVRGRGETKRFCTASFKYPELIKELGKATRRSLLCPSALAERHQAKLLYQAGKYRT